MFSCRVRWGSKARILKEFCSAHLACNNSTEYFLSNLWHSLKALDKKIWQCVTLHTHAHPRAPLRARTHTHIPNHSSASHKAVPVNCAIKALKGVVEEIKLLWKSMTDMTGRPQRQASNTLYPPPHLSLRHTHTQPTFFPCPSLLHSDHHFILSGWISNQRKKKKHLTGKHASARHFILCLSMSLPMCLYYLWNDIVAQSPPPRKQISAQRGESWEGHRLERLIKSVCCFQ